MAGGPRRIDLGGGHALRLYVFAPDLDLNPRYRDLPGSPEDPVGAIEEHPRPDDGRPCEGAITFDVPRARAASLASRDRYWTVESWDPITLAPSLLCETCGSHGFVRAGKWVAA